MHIVHLNVHAGVGIVILIKASSPGWEKEFQDEGELKKELFQYICAGCRDGVKEYYDDGLVYESFPVYINSSIGEMLSTSCGCEFYVDGIDDE